MHPHCSGSGSTEIQIARPIPDIGISRSPVNYELAILTQGTEQDIDDPSQVGPLLNQIEHEIGQVTADGAYDGAPTYETIAQRDPLIEVVIPPRATAQPSAQFETKPCTRDTHLLLIQSLGRLDWQEATGYGRRALVETTTGRYKAIIGPRLRARHWDGQQTEAIIAVAVLNRMLGAGRPNSVRGGISRSGVGVTSTSPASVQQRRARIIIAGIETMHMIRKGQMNCPEGATLSAAQQFYCLAV